MKKLGAKQSIKALGKRFKERQAQEQEVGEAGVETIHERFTADVLLRKKHINTIEKEINDLKDYRIAPDLILSVNEDLEYVIRQIAVYKQLVRENTSKDAKKVKVKLE